VHLELKMKHFIENRDGRRISVLVETNKNPRGLVFVMHGLSGNKEQPHIMVMINAFKERGYNVISFDTTNTHGESDGNLEDATITNYYADLEDIISWSKNQEWYKEPFILAGHSVGGICVLLYAQKFPDKIMALAPISTVISGELSFQNKKSDSLEKWRREGMKTWVGHSGRTKRLKWSHMEDRLKYDVLREVDKIRVPVLLIVGENDDSTPVEHHKILYNALKSQKEFHIIKGAEHTFRTPEQLDEIKDIFLKWIDNLSKPLSK